MARKIRTYKIADKPYRGAMKRAKEDNTHLATLIEGFIMAYGGYNVTSSEVKEYLSENAPKKK